MPYQGVALFVMLGVGIVAAIMYLAREQERLEQQQQQQQQQHHHQHQPYGYPGYDNDFPRLPNVQRSSDSNSSNSSRRIRNKKNNSNGSAPVCAVCIDEIYPGGSQSRKLRCSHIFHVTCIDRWARSKRECPVCRAYF